MFFLHVFHIPSLEGTTHEYVTLLLDFMSWPWPKTSRDLVGSTLLPWDHHIPMDQMGTPVQLLFFCCTKLLFMPLKQNHLFLLEVPLTFDVNKRCASRCNYHRNVMSFWHCTVPPCTLLRELQLVAQEDIIMPEILFAS